MSLDNFTYTISDCDGRLFTLETGDIGAPIVVIPATPADVEKSELLEQEWNSYGNVQYPGRFLSFEGEPAPGKLIVSQPIPGQWMLRTVPDQCKFYIGVPDTDLVIGIVEPQHLALVRWDAGNQRQVWEVNIILT